MPPLPSSGGSHMRSTLPQRVVKQLANATAADAARGWPRGREQGTGDSGYGNQGRTACPGRMTW